MQRTSFSTVGLILVFAVVLTGLGANAVAAPPRQEPLPSRRTDRGFDEHPLWVMPPSTLDVPEEAIVPNLVPWSKLVFQSYRDQNWEIYLAEGDGSNQRRLTENGGSDIHPRLNRGCTRIVFASMRTGNYDIFAMNLDGSGLTQLTSNGADDVQPFWSPDGTQIAFQSYRDGQAEIYVMEADGSGQVRLTWDNEYDGEPAWSPDGAQIAFTSKRAGQYHIWVMNADGSGQRQLSTQPLSENPAWSPDGRQIAYDADDDSNGSQTLWLMDADGFNQRSIYDPYTENTDAWARSWSADGRYLAFTEISWIRYHGDWYWTQAHILAWDSREYRRIVDLSEEDTDWRPDWQTIDIAAPTSRVDALPPYQRNGLEIRWSGNETGGSWLKTYDVQYRDGVAGGWTDWQMDTTETSAIFEGMPGHQYYFRSRARDHAFNVERWPPGDGDTFTTLYTWKVEGQVRDNSGTPVQGAAITTTPAAFQSPPSDDQGGYAAYVDAEAGAYAVDWAKSGYGSLPLTTYDAAQDVEVHVVLPPADSAILNWGFESGGLEPGWSARGVVSPTVNTEFRHTGSYAASMGQSPFTSPWDVSRRGSGGDPHLAVDGHGGVYVVWESECAIRASDGTWSGPYGIHGIDAYPQVAVDESGAVHVVGWQDAMPDDIYYIRRAGDGTWSASQNISNTPGDAYRPRLALDGSGVLHVVWGDDTSGSGDIYYARRATDGTWTGAQNISNSSEASLEPQLAVDENGIAHVVWYEELTGKGEAYYARRGSDGTWSAPQNLSNTSGSSYGPHVAVEASGVVHVVWSEGTSSGGNIYYRRRDSDGTWSSLQDISNTPGGSASPQVAVGGSGTVHVVWPDYTPGTGDIYHTWQGGDGTWSASWNISHSPGHSFAPRLMVDTKGTAHVVWTDAIAGRGSVYYAQRGNGGDWSSSWPISTPSVPSNSPCLAVEGSGLAHIAWLTYEPGDTSVYHTSSVLAAQTGYSALEQTVHVPSATPAPVLSFLYQFGSVAGEPGTWLEVQVDDGIGSTPVFSTAESTQGWTHAWADLSAWAGQTVKLALATHHTAGLPHALAYLDEVSLGAAYPDLWVDKEAQSSTALPGEQVTFALSYGNRGGVPAGGVRVTDTLPSELLFVEANPPPTTSSPSLVWDAGDLPAKSEAFTIVVTASVLAAAPTRQTYTNTVRIGAAAPELEVANNVALAPVFTGRRIYVPLVLRGK